MFNIVAIASAPTTIDRVHESVLRAGRILEVVKILLDADTPPTVIRHLIEDMEARSDGQSS